MAVELIRSLLDRLQKCVEWVQRFGAWANPLLLNPPLREVDVAAFEEQYGTRLPLEYRRFLLELGNGGAGPHYGLHPLGKQMIRRNLAAFHSHADAGWSPSTPFAHSYYWNRARPELDDEAVSQDERDLELECWQEKYHDPRLMNGAIPLSDLGCGLSDWLVVTGKECGHVWGDYRADGSGIVPLGLPGKRRITFDDWYLAWLHRSIAVAEGREPLPPEPHSMTARVPTLFDDVE